MNNNPKVSARPPEKKEHSLDRLDDLAKAFVKDGTLETEATSETKTVRIYPWEAARDDVYKTFNLRLPEEYSAKLDYVAMKLKTSKHSICMNVVKKEIDRLLSEVDQ
jgi:hypothetical protein